jgi:predicted O-linked N-acetylglucosamine transferase (SPINDLY family)
MSSQPVELANTDKLFGEAIQKSTLKQLSLFELFNSAAELQSLHQQQRALELYKTWIAYNSENELVHAAYFNYGVALRDAGDGPGAINAFRECIRLKPDFPQAYINLGRLFEDAGQTGLAIGQWNALVNRLPAITGDAVEYKLSALQQIGRVLESINHDANAENVLKQSLDIKPEQVEVAQHWIALRQRQCKWPVIEEWPRVSRKQLLGSISSLSLECLSDDPMFQLARAYHYAKTKVGMPRLVGRPREGGRHDRLRIGYVSSDLREHAVGFGMTDMLEQHNRDKCEIFAYYCGITRTDPTQQRIMKAVEHWVDITKMNDDEAATKIAGDGIDILIDLNGYTKDARTTVFARRPAPIAVNWYGFPGTMGTPYHHYLIGDRHIIPEAHDIFFSEKVVRLECYQPNDRMRPVDPRRPTRTEVGLPENAFVYCCLNGMQKITPRTFHRWMMILGAVPDSVLWLLEGNGETNDRVREAAAAHGIAAERIIFAQKLANPQHLARYPLADMFLDTLPYGAHTTAADSLMMGVPILTLTGRSFPARVCGDVLLAAGLNEMLCTAPDEYVQKAVELGHNRQKLAAIKAKLADVRQKSLLFDTPKLAAAVEGLYEQMWSEFASGQLPVPDLRNLDVYHEIGLTLDLENIEAVSDEAYLALYREKLTEWDRSYPLQPDSRLWQPDRLVAKTGTKGRKVA